MAKKELSQTVDRQIRRMYARMATEAAKSAIKNAGYALSKNDARLLAVSAEEWFERAGAKATDNLAHQI